MQRLDEKANVKMSRANRYVFGFLAAVVIAFAMGATAAANLYVNDATGNDLNTCTSVGAPCKTIQAAINKASSGDTINVAAGTYFEIAPGPWRSTRPSPC